MATKYVSSLTGEEMDAALIDMAYHNSEAYAVGTRNGVPVGSSDVTYHNNSKYWAEQVYGYTDRAEDAANRAEAAVPSGTAGAVFFDRAQTLTSAEQAQARANIMAGGSNRNLLDNPWWGSGEVVNQRSANQLNQSAYGIDRWKGGSSGSVSVTSTGLTFGSSGGNAWQPMESALLAWMVGKVFTASALMSDGTIYSGTGTYGTGTTYFLSNPVELFISPAGNFNVRTSSAATVRAVKLELGSVSTLANDAPPDYGEELAKCRLYFERIQSTGKAMTLGFGYPDGYHTLYASFKINPKRAGLSSVSVSPSLLVGQGSTSSASNVAVYHSIPNGQVTLVITAANAFQTQGVLYRCLIPAGGYIDFSADL